MKKMFDMSNIGLLSFYGITLCRTHYAKRIVELDGMTGYNLAHTPMEEKLKLCRESMMKEVDPTHYWWLIWSLRYLVHTRPRVRRQVHESVHGAANDGASIGCQANPTLRGGHPRL